MRSAFAVAYDVTVDANTSITFDWSYLTNDLRVRIDLCLRGV
ncbi:MAG: hypothetical protein R3C28_04180 [Pirellulaceae bacterium]